MAPAMDCCSSNRSKANVLALSKPLYSVPNPRLVLITNVKYGKLHDELSVDLGLCASNQDHVVVEPLIPPQGAILGEQVTFCRYDGKPEDVINPTKKQLEKITPECFRSYDLPDTVVFM